MERHKHTAQDERIKELERMVGRLTMENELLAVQHTLQERSEDSLIVSGPGSTASNGGARRWIYP